MATQKKIIGKLPVFRGEYNKDVVYYKHNIVTYLGSSFISTKDENMSAPCTVGDKEFILSSGWGFFSDSSEAYFMDERFDEMAEVTVTTDDEDEVNDVESDIVNEALRKTPQTLSKAEQAQARTNIGAASLEENEAFKTEVEEQVVSIDAKVSDIGSEVEQINSNIGAEKTPLEKDEIIQQYVSRNGYLQDGGGGYGSFVYDVSHLVGQTISINSMIRNNEYVCICAVYDKDGRLMTQYPLINEKDDNTSIQTIFMDESAKTLYVSVAIVGGVVKEQPIVYLYSDNISELKHKTKELEEFNKKQRSYLEGENTSYWINSSGDLVDTLTDTYGSNKYLVEGIKSVIYVESPLSGNSAISLYTIVDSSGNTIKHGDTTDVNSKAEIDLSQYPTAEFLYVAYNVKNKNTKVSYYFNANKKYNELKSEIKELNININGNYATEDFIIDKGSYNGHFLFKQELPIGSVITGFQRKNYATVYLTGMDGQSKVNLTEQKLPYTTTSVYKGLRANIVTDGTIKYSIGEPIGGIKEKIREIVRITKDDTDSEVFRKMRKAYVNGYCDVFFEKATYTLSEVYNEIIEVQGTWTVGLPVGNGCRYYMNGSTIISNAPENGYSDSRNILDSQARASDYEVHDAILINNGGRYCIHDEGNGSSVAYQHKYYNVTAQYNKTELTPDSGSTAFGCGLGYDATLIFDGCQFMHSVEGNTPMFIHGVVNPTKKQTFRMKMTNSYIHNKFFGTNLIGKDLGYVEYFLTGNLWGENPSLDCSKKIVYNNHVGVMEVTEYPSK